MRTTTFDVMTNLPVAPPPSIWTYVWEQSSTAFSGLSPLTIQNVSTGMSLTSYSYGNAHLYGYYYGVAKDILSDGVMDVTLALSPRLVRTLGFFTACNFYI